MRTAWGGQHILQLIGLGKRKAHETWLIPEQRGDWLSAGAGRGAGGVWFEGGLWLAEEGDRGRLWPSTRRGAQGAEPHRPGAGRDILEGWFPCRRKEPETLEAHLQKNKQHMNRWETAPPDDTRVCSHWTAFVAYS